MTQQTLFASSATRNSGRPKSPPSRRGDPSTSARAAAKFEASGARGRHEKLILAAMTGQRPLTYVEIAERTGGLNGVQVMRRLSGKGSLSDRGLVVRCERRRCRINKSPMQTWRVA